jgi:hypothetical protein
LEVHAACIFRVEAFRARNWLCCIGRFSRKASLRLIERDGESGAQAGNEQEVSSKVALLKSTVLLLIAQEESKCEKDGLLQGYSIVICYRREDEER